MPMTLAPVQLGAQHPLTTSIAFFDATEMLMATRRHNSYTKRALIIICAPGATLLNVCFSTRQRLGYWTDENVPYP